MSQPLVAWTGHGFLSSVTGILSTQLGLAVGLDQDDYQLIHYNPGVSIRIFQTGAH